MDYTEKTSGKIDIIGIMCSMLRYARRLWLLGLILGLLGAAASGFLAHRRYVPVYRASMTFTVQLVNPLYGSINDYNAKTAEQMEATFPYILTSAALQQRVKAHLGVSYIPAVRAEALAGSNIFTMSVQDTNPQRTHDVLQAVVSCYGEVADYVVGPTAMVLLDDSGVPAVPINSNNVTYACAAGALAGLVLWAAYILLLTVTRTTIQDEHALMRMLNIPCLGTIPVTKVVGPDLVCPIIHKSDRQYGFSESVRSLQMRLVRELEGSAKQVVIVSSAIPSEGKTTISVNLALALAETGKRVLLLDCDAYNPSVLRATHNLDSDETISYHLNAGNKSVWLHRMDTDGLYVAAMRTDAGAGKSRQLTYRELAELIDAAKMDFDLILLDTPPCSLLVDAAEMADFADCAVMVVRQDYASRSQILDGTRLLTDSGLPLVGCVLNGISDTLASGSYGYGYGYGYGYHRSKYETE